MTWYPILETEDNAVSLVRTARLQEATEQAIKKVMRNDLPLSCTADEALAVGIAVLHERLLRIENEVAS